MTIKELVGKSVEELEAMTDAELDDYTLPYRTIVETPAKEEDDILDLDDTKEKVERKKKSREEWMKELQQLAQTHGISLDTKLPKGLK